jgi:PAS domain S-box-containing protein
MRLCDRQTSLFAKSIGKKHHLTIRKVPENFGLQTERYAPIMRSSIRKRLTLAFIGLSIGPLFLVGIILAGQSFTTQEKQALNLQREVARRVSSEAKAFLDELESELRLVGQAQGLHKLDLDKQRDILAELLVYQNAFESLALLDSQGQERVHLARSGTMTKIDVNRAQTDEFVIAQSSGQSYYGPVHFDAITGEPFITIAVPLLDVRTGLADGVLISEVRFRRIWDLIMNLQTSPGQSVYIIDTQDKVIAHRNPSVVLRGTTFHVPNQEGIHPGLTGSSVVLAVDKVHLGGQTFYVVAEQTVAEALALAINTILIIVILMVGALLISGGLGLVIVRQLVQPIQAMATTAEAISAGDFSRQVQVTSHDEVGILAAAFNSMTTQLRQSLENLEQQVVEIKQAEESLRRANGTLQALIDHSPLAIIMLALDSHILLWNTAAEKLYGWTAQEVLGKSLPSIPEDKREEHRSILEQVNQGKILTNLELERKRKDGSRILSSVSIAPLLDSTGNVYAHMSIVTDITERKKAEQALKESEERLRQIASSLREVIWLRDAQTRQVLYVNPAFEELTGRSCESFYENQDIVKDAIHPDDREFVSKALEQRNNGVLYHKEHRIIHFDGSMRWVSSRSFPVRNETGELYRWVSTMEDITARKQAEEEIRRLNAELEERVLERTAQLQTANKELEAFSYSVSHDLQAPLRAISGFSRILIADYEAALPEEAQRLLSHIQHNAMRMSDLINDLLAFSRIGRKALHVEDVDVNGLVQEVLNDFRISGELKQAEIVVEALPPCQADHSLLKQVWINLISNAIKYSSKCENPRVEIRSIDQNHRNVYVVKDNGVGFDMRYAGKLFGVFQRLHREDEYEGTGIGLAVVRRIIERHGGSIWAEAELGKGATFYFTI